MCLSELKGFRSIFFVQLLVRSCVCCTLSPCINMFFDVFGVFSPGPNRSNVRQIASVASVFQTFARCELN